MGPAPIAAQTAASALRLEGFAVWLAVSAARLLRNRRELKISAPTRFDKPPSERLSDPVRTTETRAVVARAFFKIIASNQDVIASMSEPKTITLTPNATALTIAGRTRVAGLVCKPI